MEKKREFIINMLYIVLIIAVLVLFFRYIFPALIPFVIGFVVACIIHFFAKKIGGNSDKNKKSAALTLTICFYTVLFTLAVLVGLKAVDKIGGFIRSIPAMYKDFVLPLLEQILEKVEEIAMQLDERIATEVEKTLSEFLASLGKFITDLSLKLVSAISDGILGIPAFLIRLIIIVVSTFFMAADFDKMTGLVRKLIGEKKYGVIVQGTYHAQNVILAYIKSYSILFCLTFVELCIGFWILKIPYPGWIALAIAIFDILPILGTGGVLIPWSFICLFIGNIKLGICIFILYIIITAIRNTLEPKIIGKQIGLHPLLTLMAMFVGMQLLGLFGLFLFPITLVILVSMAKAGAIHLGGVEKDL